MVVVFFLAVLWGWGLAAPLAAAALPPATSAVVQQAQQELTARTGLLRQ